MKKLVLLSVLAVVGSFVSPTPAQAARVDISIGNPAPCYSCAPEPGVFYSRHGVYTGHHSHSWYKVHHHHYEEIF
jgi:hypothetical protein